jgi:hypothetical protein
VTEGVPERPRAAASASPDAARIMAHNPMAESRRAQPNGRHSSQPTAVSGPPDR